MQKLILLAVLALGVFLTAKADAGGPWSDQYCDMKSETVITKDTSGKVIDTKTVEKVVCEDGVKDFLHGMAIAKDCKYFTWYIPLGEKMVQQRSIACQRMDGGYEIVPGYHYIK